MKFKVAMKDPDMLANAIEDAVENDLLKTEGLTDDDRESIFDTRRKDVEKVASKWFKYGEYLTVEIDTDAQTATVCEAA